MKKWLNGRGLLQLCISAVLALEVLLTADSVVVFLGGALSPFLGAGLLGMLTLCAAVLFRKKQKLLLKTVVCIPLCLALAGVFGCAGWRIFCHGAAYESGDNGKYQIYGDRKVMLVVPHQDDDINILGGVLEEYARYGSELIPVFVTSGDYSGLEQTRYEEAVQYFESMDVPAEQVVFLGYGNEWKEGGPHIYNADPGQVMQSHSGRVQTYGTEDYPAYRKDREYTIDNLTEDLKDVILEHRPDVIFCSDYDHHIDHKSTSLLFEKVMGRILKQDPQYRPVVYKAYAYGTAWEAEPDYYADNIRSTRNLYAEHYGQKPVVYHWEDRVRFPVDGSLLSRSLVGSGAYELLSFYSSQGAQGQAARVVNGDKTAWQRRTDSLCLTAALSASSGNVTLLNDFMLVENRDLTDAYRMPYDGVWIPEQSDHEKNAVVTLAQPKDIAAVCLYDHPSEEHNVLNAQILFDDGTVVETGLLDPGGAATLIRVDKKNVSAFSVRVVQTEGELAGLSEIEAFETESDLDGAFIKLMDREGNFLYDYRMPKEGTAELLLYGFGDLPELTAESCTVGTSWNEGAAVLDGDVIRVSCPRGGKFVLNVTCSEAGVSDSICIRNPGVLERCWVGFWQKVEDAVFTRYSRGDWKNLLVFSIPEKLSYVIRHLQ